MEWSIVGLNVLYAAVGLVMMYLAFRIAGSGLVAGPLAEELKKGNMAIAIVVGSLFVAIAMIIAGALS